MSTLCVTPRAAISILTLDARTCAREDHRIHTARLAVRLTTRASRDAIVGEREGTILVRVTAPLVNGAANEPLIRLLAKQLHVAKGSVRIISGEISRMKSVKIEGLGAYEVRARLGLE